MSAELGVGIYSFQVFHKKEEKLEISELKTQLKKSENIEQCSLSYTVGPCWFSMLLQQSVHWQTPKLPNSLTIPSPILPLGDHQVITEYWAEFAGL